MRMFLITIKDQGSGFNASKILQDELNRKVCDVQGAHRMRQRPVHYQKSVTGWILIAGVIVLQFLKAYLKLPITFKLLFTRPRVAR